MDYRHNGMAGPRTLGIPLHAKVKDAVGPNGWKLRRTKMPNLNLLLAQIRSRQIPRDFYGGMDLMTSKIHSPLSILGIK